MNRICYFDHNWLALKRNNDGVQKHSKFMRGVVYDLGCGLRPFEIDISTTAEKYIGVDWLGSYHDVKPDIVADLNMPLPIESGVADTILSFSVMEHLCEPQTMLNEACRILKPGGAMLLQVPWQWWIHEAPYDFFRYTPYGLRYMFEKAGFVDVVIEPQSGFFSMWILKMNYFSTRFVRGPKLIFWLSKACLVPVWYLGQTLAPVLDKLDRNWEVETTGYFVTAKKPNPS